MKILLLAVLATLSWASPIYERYLPHENPGYNPEVSYVRIKNHFKYYCAVLQVKNYYEEYMRDQSYRTNNAQISHSPAEIMAQSVCTAINNNNGYVYAVQRICAASSGTCEEICTSRDLAKQDPQTHDYTWVAAAALHVYVDRPSSDPGTAADPHIGLKVLRYPNIHQSGCGPNFCCCLVPYQL